MRYVAAIKKLKKRNDFGIKTVLSVFFIVVISKLNHSSLGCVFSITEFHVT